MPALLYLIIIEYKIKDNAISGSRIVSVSLYMYLILKMGGALCVLRVWQEMERYYLLLRFYFFYPLLTEDNKTVVLGSC